MLIRRHRQVVVHYSADLLQTGFPDWSRFLTQNRGLPEYPGIPEAAPGYHHRRAPGFFHRSNGRLGRKDVATCYYRNGDYLFHRLDHPKIGPAAVSLVLGSSVDAYCVSPGILDPSSDIRRIDGLTVPAGTDLDRNRRPGMLHEHGDEASEEFRLSEEGCTLTLACNLFYGACSVQIKDIVGVTLKGGDAFDEVLGLAGEELNPQGAVYRRGDEEPECFSVTQPQGSRVHHLGEG
jgi:hypothetical protein